MSDPHNYRKVGYSMIVVSASLVAIALVGLAIMSCMQIIFKEKRQHILKNVLRLIL